MGRRRRPRCSAAGPEIVVLDASGGEPWSNRAVVGLGAEPAPEEGAQGIAVVAEIANFAAEPVRGLGITLRLDGDEVARGFVDVPAGGRARKRFVHTVSGGARQAEVVIDHDGFALDDRRACRVEASRGLRVLLVDGDPRTVRTEDEVFFLEAALRAGGSNFSVTTVLPDDLDEPRSRDVRRRVPGQRRAAERHRRPRRSRATWRAAAACSSRSAIASTPTRGTRR